MTEIKEPSLEQGWKNVLLDEFSQDYFKALKQFLVYERSKFTVYPKVSNIFAAFNKTPFDSVKVVIIGQDPYHNERQANGLSFSVAEGIKTPPSLVNIFKELKNDLGADISASGNLEKWATQGVLLLNAILTVRANEAGSHQKKGWENFTNAAIKSLSQHKTGIVFLLWGKFAQGKAEFIDTNKHHILLAAHPSPLARGAFFGSKHFSKTNEILKTQGKSPIDWDLTKK